MSEHKAREARETKVAEEQKEKAAFIALLAAVVYPHIGDMHGLASQERGAVSIAYQIYDDALLAVKTAPSDSGDADG